MRLVLALAAATFVVSTVVSGASPIGPVTPAYAKMQQIEMQRKVHRQVPHPDLRFVRQTVVQLPGDEAPSSPAQTRHPVMFAFRLRDVVTRVQNSLNLLKHIFKDNFLSSYILTWR